MSDLDFLADAAQRARSSRPPPSRGLAGLQISFYRHQCAHCGLESHTFAFAMFNGKPIFETDILWKFLQTGEPFQKMVFERIAPLCCIECLPKQKEPPCPEDGQSPTET